MANTYRELQDNLDEILEQMQNPSIDIDDALKLYKKGSLVIEKLQKRLEDTKVEIEKISRIA